MLLGGFNVNSGIKFRKGTCNQLNRANTVKNRRFDQGDFCSSAMLFLPSCPESGLVLMMYRHRCLILIHLLGVCLALAALMTMMMKGLAQTPKLSWIQMFSHCCCQNLDSLTLSFLMECWQLIKYLRFTALSVSSAGIQGRFCYPPRPPTILPTCRATAARGAQKPRDGSSCSPFNTVGIWSVEVGQFGSVLDS